MRHHQPAGCMWACVHATQCKGQVIAVSCACMSWWDIACVRVCVASSRVWPGLSPDVSLSLAWRSIDLYGNTACSHSRSDTLSLSLISAQLWDACCVLSFDCASVCVSACVCKRERWSETYSTLQKVWEHKSVTGTSDHQKCECACMLYTDSMCWRFNISVWTHICLFVIKFRAVNSHTVSLFFSYTLGLVLTEPVGWSIIPTSTIQHPRITAIRPFVYSPFFPLLLVFLPSQYDSVLPCFTPFSILLSSHPLSPSSLFYHFPAPSKYLPPSVSLFFL